MTTYIMECPIHRGEMTANDNSIRTFNYADGRKKKMPIFYCKSCRCYYITDSSTKNNRERLTTQYKGKDLYLTSNEYKRKPISPPKHNDKIIRIKEFKREGLSAKIKSDIDNIRKSYPQIIPENMSFNQFVKKIFPAKMTQRIVARNMSYIGNNGYKISYAEIYNKNSSYLKNKLPDDTYLSFRGRLKSGEFVIESVHVIENPVQKMDDTVTTMKFLYDGPKHSNWLYDITNDIAEQPQKLTGEIANWNEYLDWKRQLAELKIRGLKYIAYDFNIDEREMFFLAVADGKESFDEFRKFLRRNEVSIFSNKYSLNRWSFEFNRDYQDWQNNDSGVALAFSRIEHRYHPSEIDSYRWAEVKEYAKKYKENNVFSVDDLMDNIQREYTNPIVFELVFELSPSANSIINRQIRRYGSVSEDIIELLSDEFYGDGYIATSQIGDFALLNRLKNSVNDLINGKSASQGLDQWLFNIEKARFPQVYEEVDYWQNENINETQKQAIKKILSVPDVCLIQGPPGTGKTTVIAEAIYQLVTRNKRVLVASQANLAVDNALERLISNPKIRAIRLGSAKKIDSSVSNITEGNVLETFYDSIVTYIDNRYLKKWKGVDDALKAIERDVEDFRALVKDKNEIEVEVAKCHRELTQIESLWNSDIAYSNKNNYLMLKSQVTMLSEFCKGNMSELVGVIDENTIISIWKCIQPTVEELSNKGLYLSRINIDSNDLGSPKRLNLANDTLVHALKNARIAENLYKKLDTLDSFNTSNTELEELKIREGLLKEKVLSGDTEALMEWKNVNEQIKNMVNAGLGLSDLEYELFRNEYFESLGKEEQKLYMESTLDFVIPKIQMLFNNIQDEINVLVEIIQGKIVEVDDKAGEIEKQKKSIESQLEALKLQTTQDDIKIEKYLNKYTATPETFRDEAAEKYIRIKKNGKTDIAREEWEDLFLDLKQWVYEIPDYSSEKDIYLKDFINGCNVVGVSCTENTKTLTENGFDDFDVVIIDEVSKATPPELLIPMLRGKKIVLVGDHRQLPPLFNEHEKTYQEVAEQQDDMEDMIVELTMEDFEKYKDMVTSSLFQRYFENAPESIKETLTYQYRMHTDIMDIINIFYDEQLKDGNAGTYTTDTKAHYLNIKSTSGTEMIIPERHAYWLDSSMLAGEKVFEQRRQGSTSAENILEAEMILELLRKMELQYANMKNMKKTVSIGVISFYYDQVALIRQMLKKESFHAIDVEVNTVDRFQGKEKEIIFVSLVRNVESFHHNVNSHIAAFQRINVAFSRAQNLLIIVGAKDMYIDQPVKLTDMNDGAEKVIMAYKLIVEKMDNRGTFFTSDEVIPDIRAEEILRILKRNKGGDE